MENERCFHTNEAFLSLHWLTSHSLFSSIFFTTLFLKSTETEKNDGKESKKHSKPSTDYERSETAVTLKCRPFKNEMEKFPYFPSVGYARWRREKTFAVISLYWILNKAVEIFISCIAYNERIVNFIRVSISRGSSSGNGDRFD